MRSCESTVALPLALCLASARQGKATNSEWRRLQADAETAAANKGLVRSFLAAVDRNDFPRLRERSADDGVFWTPGLPAPIQLLASLEVVKRTYTSFPDWRHPIEDIIAEGDRVAVKVIQRGTQKAEYNGIAATGKEVTMPGAYFFRISNGKIQGLWLLEDNLGLYQQLGLELKTTGQE